MRISSFLLSLCLLFASPLSFGAAHDAIEHLIYADGVITINKVTQSEALEAFKNPGFVGNYLKKLHYRLESPFGVYIAYESSSMNPVAIQSFSDGKTHDSICAHPEINVLETYQGCKYGEAYQGPRYGSTLLTKTAKHLDQFFGKHVLMTDGTLSELPLSCIISASEWEFGENYPSLKSALNAGYGINCISFFGTLSMRYPVDATVWDEKRRNALIAFSKVMMNPGSAADPAIMCATMAHMAYILNDLDFTREADITTLLSVAERVIKIANPDSFEGPDPYIAPETRPIYQAIYEGPLREVFAKLGQANLQLISDFVAKGYAPVHNFKGVLQHFE